MSLAELRERVATLTERGNFQFECDLAIALGISKTEKLGALNIQDTPPPYTRSVDAAIALVEMKLPDHQWGVHCHKSAFRAHVTKRSPFRPMPNIGDAPTPALALISALLAALEERAAAGSG